MRGAQGVQDTEVPQVPLTEPVGSPLAAEQPGPNSSDQRPRPQDRTLPALIPQAPVQLHPPRPGTCCSFLPETQLLPGHTCLSLNKPPVRKSPHLGGQPLPLLSTSPLTLSPELGSLSPPAISGRPPHSEPCLHPQPSLGHRVKRHMPGWVL